MKRLRIIICVILGHRLHPTCSFDKDGNMVILWTQCTRCGLFEQIVDPYWFLENCCKLRARGL